MSSKRQQTGPTASQARNQIYLSQFHSLRAEHFEIAAANPIGQVKYSYFTDICSCWSFSLYWYLSIMQNLIGCVCILLRTYHSNSHFSAGNNTECKEQRETPGNCKRAGVNLQHLSEMNNVYFSGSLYRLVSSPWEWKNTFSGGKTEEKILCFWI